MDWKISTVARKLGIHQPNLSRKIKDLGLEKTINQNTPAEIYTS